MATFTPFNSTALKLATGAFGNIGTTQLAMTLCAAGNAPTASNGVLSDLTPISLTNVDGDMLLTTSASETVDTKNYQVTVLDKQITADGGDVGPFRYAVVYSATTDDLIAFYDFEDNLTIPDGTSMNFDFSQENGLFKVIA